MSEAVKINEDLVKTIKNIDNANNKLQNNKSNKEKLLIKNKNGKPN